MEIFSKNLQITIQSMLDNSISIASTSTCELLSEKTKLPFKAYVRPSYLVDCYHFFDDPQIVTETTKKLDARGIYGFFTLIQK
ncbi:hypothetical protein ACD661_15210 [Legionella lytica]|uniref:Uncharacterized protein n=1 Tax=Legionella lytica TaxID=96232 RepID=A0ABW8DB30_9GAMM